MMGRCMENDTQCKIQNFEFKIQNGSKVITFTRNYTNFLKLS